VALLQTRDCILLGSADVDLSSNSVDCCGSNFYDPHTSVDRTHCGRGNSIAVLATQGARPPTAAAIVVGLNREDIEWAKYRSNNVVLEGAAVPCRRMAIYPGLSNDNP